MYPLRKTDMVQKQDVHFVLVTANLFKHKSRGHGQVSGKQFQRVS